MGPVFSAVVSSKGNSKWTLCNYLGADKCVFGNSGRALLYVLLDSLKRKGGDLRDEVLIPGYTCYSVAASVAKAGLKIAIYDLDPCTFAPDMDSVKANLSEHTLAVISQHLFGIPTPLDEIRQIAKEQARILSRTRPRALVTP